MDFILPEFQTFNGVATGQTANISVPAGGPTYEAFYLEHKFGASPALATAAEFATNVANIKVKAGGEILFDGSGADLNIINNYYGYPQVDGYFPIMFARPHFDDIYEQKMFALGTLDRRNVTVEITLNAVTNPSLRMWGNVLPGVKRPMGQVIKITSTAQSAQAASGVREIHDLPIIDPYKQQPHLGLMALHIKSGNISEHEIVVNGDTLNEAPKELSDLVADHRAMHTVSRTPQTNVYTLDFGGNRYSGILPMSGVTDFRAKLTFSAAESAFDIIHEQVIGTPDR